MNRAFRFVVLALSLALAAPASAAVVYLKDGRAIRGTVVAATARDLTLSTPEGTLTFDTGAVSRVDYAQDAQAGALPPSQSSRAAPYQFTPLKNELNLGIGFAVPLGHADFSGAGGGSIGNGQLGAAFTLGYWRALDRRWSAGAAFEYLTRSGEVTAAGVPAGLTEVSGESAVLLAMGKRSFADGRIKPYLRAGVGGHRTSTTADAAPQEGFVWSDTGTAEARRLARGGSWGFAAGAGAGLDFELGLSSFFSLDAGWTGLESARLRPTDAGARLGLQGSSPRLDIISVSGRWGWRF